MRESAYNVWVDQPDTSWVYNGLSGSVLRLPAAERAALQRYLADGTCDDLSTEVVTNLTIGRMLVTDDADETEVLAARYARSRQNANRFALTIVTSLGCNFDCPYCFEDKHPSILAPDVEDAVLAVLDDQLARIERFEVTWFGGEPLVGKRPLLALSDAFIERCDRAGVDYGASIITNGYLLDRDTARQLAARRVTQTQIGLDGPPDVHDRMRPRADGGPTFERIVANIIDTADLLEIVVRVNLDTDNVDRTEELLAILADAGLAGRIGIYPGHLVGVAENAAAPSSTYAAAHACLTTPAFAHAALQFGRLAQRYGFGSPDVPEATGTPCTAVRDNELVVGSAGELYKCWDSVGSPFESIGHISDYRNTNGRLRRWLAYDPFANEECRSCIALPVCMGGCAHHAMDLDLREDRCGTFRYTYQERVADYVTHRATASVPVDVPTRAPRRARAAGEPAEGTTSTVAS